MRPHLFLTALLAAPLHAQSSSTVKPEPWRLHRALGLPEWLDVSVQHRTRFESLSENFRATLPGNTPRSHQAFALRTLIAATAHIDDWSVGAELQDSRVYGEPEDRPLTTGDVNAVELLQGFVGLSLEDSFADGDSLDLKLGRQTMDIGSRRLVARNRFRNTINAFTGLTGDWQGAGGSRVQAFATVPVLRLPRDQASLHDNEIEFDEELENTLFLGTCLTKPLTDGGTSGELYALHLDEADEKFVATRDRRLWTVGARVHSQPKAGEVQFEWESAYQFGKSRALTSGLDIKDLDHEAFFHHLSVGYRFHGDLKVNVEALFDYASGDKDPSDDENNRFDTLYGARRFEYGPTGLFGAFARSNNISPGLRLNLSPTSRSQLMIAHRLHYLAEKRDFWTTSGLVDASGSSGDFIGQLLEARLRYEVVPKSWKLEFGIAHLFAGSFMENAPNNTGQGDSTYGYAATTFSF